MIRRVLCWTGVILLLVFSLYLLGVPGDGVPILTYHHVGSGKEWYYVSPAEFEAQLRYLRDSGYQSVSTAQLADVLAGKVKSPPRPLVITFDDGYADNFAAALPLLEKYGMTATFFVTTGKIGQTDYLSWDQIRQMHRRGMEIGSHTVNHYTLREINLKEFERELLASRLMLQNNVPITTTLFANPFGETAPAVVDLLQRTGYQAACSSVVGVNRPGENPYMLRRMSVPGSPFGLLEFRLRLWRLYAGARLNLW